MPGKATTSKKWFTKILETTETLMMLQVHFIDLEKHKKILMRSNLGCL